MANQIQNIAKVRRKEYVIEGGKSLSGEVAFEHPRRFRTFLLAEQFYICSQKSFLKGCSGDRDFSVSVLVHKHPSQGLSCH